MASTFFGLTIAASGLRAANAALNTTGNNISNVSTEGYSRQAVTTEAANALRVFAAYGCAGAGVETIAIERIRDQFYDNKYRNNETKLGEYDVKAYYTLMIQDYLTDDGASGFKTIYNQITAALEEITKNASSTSTKRQFISTIQTMTDYFNNMYGNLQNLQADVNDEIKMRVDKINSIAQELATVNKQINVIELKGGVTANELRDKRDVLLDELSAIVDINVSETPIYDQNGNPTNLNRMIVRIAGDQILVDSDTYHQLNCVARTSEEKVNQTDIDGLYDIYWENGIEFGLYNESMGGELRGLIQMRDGNNGEYFNGTITDLRYSIDTTTVTIETTAEYLNSMSKCNLSDTGGKIVLGNQVYYYTDWTYLGDGKYTFTVDNKKSEEALVNGKIGMEGYIGADVGYQGVPYFMKQMNEWLRDFSKALNDIFTEGYTADDEDAGILITANRETGGQYSEAELNDSRRNGKGYYYMTAGNAGITSQLDKDPSKLGTRSVPDATEVDEFGQVTKVISLLDDINQFSFRGRTAGGFLECVLSDIALNAKNADTFYLTYLSLETSIDNQRISISGVDEDEEALSLVKYENSYTLASKMIQVLTEIYDRLILQTGV